MKKYKLFILITLVLLIISCEEKIEDPNDFFSIHIKAPKKSYKVEDKILVSIKNNKGKNIENVSYRIDKALIDGANETSATISLSNKKMGRRKLEAIIRVDGKEFSISKEIKITASTPPKSYTYKILEAFPHDSKAFTQGLEFSDDTLYESTGKRKYSSLRKIDYTTGEVLKKATLQDAYFAEGLTVLNHKIYQLTWQARTGFIYEKDSFEKKGTFVYNKSKEGWGLCNDGASIYKSDGTEKIWKLNKNTLAEEGYIEVYTHDRVISKINELEWVEGKIYANVWQKDAIAIVNPKDGAVEGVIDMRKLQNKVTQHSNLDVLNGIAYKGESNILYVTGKNWDKLFKIEIIEK